MESGRIQLSTMPQLSEAQIENDDWTGTTAKAERRRRQNRLNQRAARRRRAERATAAKERLMNVQVLGLRPDPSLPVAISSPTHSSRSASDAWKPPVPSSIRPAIPDPHDLLSVFSVKQLVKLASQSFVHSDRLCNVPENTLTKWLARYSERLSQQLTPLSTDHLMSLIHYNLFRGFAVNSIVLGLVGMELCEELTTFKVTEDQKLPPSLMPTKLQQTVLHPTWLDLFPSPRIRDNLIRRLGTFDEDELCFDMIGELCEDQLPDEVRNRYISADGEMNLASPARERQGLILWSDPWDVASWEITPGFLRNWGWVVDGCPEAITASNKWRAFRNEVPLVDALRMSSKNL